MSPRLRLLLWPTCGVLALLLGVLALTQSRAVRQHARLWTETLVGQALGREVRAEGITLRPWSGSLELARVRVARGRSLADGVLFSAEAIQARCAGPRSSTASSSSARSC